MENDPEFKQLSGIIRAAADKLLPETHPNVCALRDENFWSLVAQVLQHIIEDPVAISVQTALAQVEQDLSDAVTENDLN